MLSKIKKGKRTALYGILVPYIGGALTTVLAMQLGIDPRVTLTFIHDHAMIFCALYGAGVTGSVGVLIPLTFRWAGTDFGKYLHVKGAYGIYQFAYVVGTIHFIVGTIVCITNPAAKGWIEAIAALFWHATSVFVVLSLFVTLFELRAAKSEFSVQLEKESYLLSHGESKSAR